jgi:hypothetical protein
MAAIQLSDYRGPTGTTVRKIDERKSSFSLMADEVLTSLSAGCDRRMPSLSDRHSEGQLVSELLANCDDKQQRLMFELVAKALSSSDAVTAAAARALAEYVAKDYAEFYTAVMS